MTGLQSCEPALVFEDAGVAMLALTTTQTFAILDESSRSLWQIDIGKGVYYGITFAGERLFIAARQAEYGGVRDGHDNVVLCYTPDLRLDAILKPPAPLRDIHQITADGDMLYVCSTFDDEVRCCHLPSGEWDVWRPFEPYPGPGLDRHHINSITVQDDEILLAGNQPKGWAARFNKASGKLKGEILWIGHQSHNVWTEQGVLNVCSSAASAVEDENGTIYQLEAKGWVRGYCAGGGKRYLGLSEALTRHDRAFSNCCVVECDDLYQPLGAFWIPDMGMAHDLRILDHADASHNGSIFELDRKSLDKRFFSQTLDNTYGSFSRDPNV